MQRFILAYDGDLSGKPTLKQKRKFVLASPLNINCMNLIKISLFSFYDQDVGDNIVLKGN